MHEFYPILCQSNKPQMQFWNSSLPLFIPFHFRGQGGLADVEKFKSMVNEKNDEIEVRLRNWYPEN